MAASQEPAGVPIPSIKDLASSESSLRRTCLKTVISHLEARDPSSPLTPTQCLQLWRGLYVALYMHDSKNALSVQNLAAELAATVEIMAAKDAELDAPSSPKSPSWLEAWTTAFWETICREWASIDQWRMDKVLLLVRFFLRSSFNVVLDAGSSSSTTDQHVNDVLRGQTRVLQAWPLSPRERKVPDGLRLHVLDIWVDELEGRVRAQQQTTGEADDSDAAETDSAIERAARELMASLKPLTSQALSKAVRLRAKEAVGLFGEKFPA